MKRITQHGIATLGFVGSTLIALSVWLLNQPGDLWSRRWLLIIIPFVSGITLLISWRQRWQDIGFGVAVTYFLAPLIAARIESCFLPIPDAVPCFADVNQVRMVADQIGHAIYYPGLLLLQGIGVAITWWYASQQGGVDASPSSSAA